VTFAAPAVPCWRVAPPVAVHAYDAMGTAAGRHTAAGIEYRAAAGRPWLPEPGLPRSARSAALTALSAFTMPAPHSLPSLGQAHSPLDGSAFGKIGAPAGCGKTTALDFDPRDQLRRGEIRVDRTHSEPRYRTRWAPQNSFPSWDWFGSCKCCRLGTVKPVFVVVSMDLRHAPDEFTQLPARCGNAYLCTQTAVSNLGADVAQSATASNPVQLPGASTGPACVAGRGHDQHSHCR